MGGDMTVVSLHGGPVLQLAEKQADVINHLEKMLEMANSGKLQSIACCVQYDDELVGHFRSGIISTRLVGEIECMKFSIVKALG
jgi:hypothetical protein